MRELFRGYYTPSPDELKALWRDCTFVLDANVLLNLYRYPEEAREDFLRLLRQVRDRLWIPHQVALEYQRNRLKVIAEQVKRFGEVRDVLAGIRKKLRSDLEQLQLKKRHPSIDPDRLLAATDAAFADFEKELEVFEKEQPDVFDDDRIRATLDTLLAGRIGPPPTKAFLETVVKEGKDRFAKKRPPGYEDAKKKSEDEVYFAGGLEFNRLYGDLILWHEILTAAKGNEKLEKIIFVTDDQKEDWWWIVDSQGKKTLGPRPELVEEILATGDVTEFYMYNSERFLEFAKANLGVRVNPESIEQVRDVASANQKRVELADLFVEAQRAVLLWLRDLYPHEGIQVSFPKGFSDFLITNLETGRKTAYEIKALRDPSFIYRFVRDAELRAFYEISKGSFDECVIVLVLETPEAVDRAVPRLRHMSSERPAGILYCAGALSSEASESGERAFEAVTTI